MSSRRLSGLGLCMGLVACATLVGAVAPNQRPAAAESAPSGGSLTTVTPARLLETRSGPTSTTTDGQFEHIGRRTAGSTTKLTVTGRAGVPTGAGSAMLNVTAIDPDAAGFLTVYPCGEQRPTASNVNYQPGDVVPNAVLAKIGTNGQVCIYTRATTDLIVDLNGYVPGHGTFGTVTPARLLETRSGPNHTTIDSEFERIGRRAAGTVTKLTVTGRGGVPTGAGSAMLNVTAINPDAPGYLTVYPCGEDRPTASNINYKPGDVVPNAVLAKIGTNGQVCIYTRATTDLIVDLNGYRPPNVEVTLDQTATVAKSIGSDGGNLAGVVGGIPFNLSIPKGSLVSTQTITATPGLSIAGTAFDSDLVSVVQFGPDGLRFSKPVTLTFEVPAGVDPTSLIAFGYQGPGELVHLVPHAIAGSTVTIELWHFSGAGIATAKAAIGSIAVYTSAAGEVVSGQIGVYLDQLAAQIALGQDVTLNVDGIAVLLQKWWDLGLAPALAEAKQYPLATFPGFEQSNAEAWIAEALNWEAVRQSLGVDPFDGIHAISTTIDVAEKAEAAANKKCVGGSDTAIAAQFNQVLDWQATIQRLGGSASVSLAGCAKLVISGAVIPEEIKSGETAAGQFILGLDFLGTGGPTHYGLPIEPNVTATGGSLTNIVGPNAGLVTFTISQTDLPTVITAKPGITIHGFEFTAERTWTVQPDVAGIDVATLVGHWYGTKLRQDCAHPVTTTASWGQVVEDGSSHYVDVFDQLHETGGVPYWQFVRLRLEANGITAYLGKGEIFSDGRPDRFLPSSDTALPVGGLRGDDYKAAVNGDVLTVIEIDTGHEGLYDDCPLSRETHNWEKDVERDPFGAWTMP